MYTDRRHHRHRIADINIPTVLSALVVIAVWSVVVFFIVGCGGASGLDDEEINPPTEQVSQCSQPIGSPPVSCNWPGKP